MGWNWNGRWNLGSWGWKKEVEWWWKVRYENWKKEDEDSSK